MEDEALRRSETVFIDNLPHGIRKVWLFNFLSRFGKVRSIYVPNKNSKTTGNKFCFVRFEHTLHTQRVVKVVNGLWLWGKTLVANIARYGTRGVKRGKQNLPKVWRPRIEKEDKPKRRAWIWRKKEETVAQQEHTIPSWVKNLHTIPVKELGNGWLYRSAIAKILSTRSVAQIQDQLKSSGQRHVLIRHMGGDMVVLTFKDPEERDTMFNGGEMAWLKDWFVESSKWEDTVTNPCSRLVWLNCYGIPLHLWNSQTFSEIGRIWGDVIKLADETAKNLSFAVGKVLISTNIMDSINKIVELVNKGKSIKIRVMEEQMVVNTMLRMDCVCPGCHMESSSKGKCLDEHMMHPTTKEDDGGEVRSKSKLDEGEAESTSPHLEEVAESTSSPPVATTVEGLTNPPLVEVAKPAQPSLIAVPSLLGPHPSLTRKPLCSVNINNMQVVPYTEPNGVPQSTRGSRLVQHDTLVGKGIVTPYLDALMNNLMLPKTHILPLKVNPLLPLIPNYVAHDSQKNLSIISQSQETSNSLNNLVQVSTLLEENIVTKDKSRRKRRSIEDILGLPKLSRSKKGGRRAKPRCVVFRSAMAAAALSVSSEGIMNRNKILVSESKATWSINKILATDFMGDDEEVISKIMVTDEEADQRSALQAQSPEKYENPPLEC